MSIGTHAPSVRRHPRRPGRAPTKWAGSDDVAALVGIVVFVAGLVALGIVRGLPVAVELGLAIVLVLVTAILPLLHRLHLGADVSIYLLLPTIMSATQNVYLLPTAHAISKGELQVFIVLNFLFALISAVAIWSYGAQCREARGLREIRLTALLMVAITAWGFVTVVLFHTGATAAFASYRNFVTPFLFLLLGLLASHTSGVYRYARHLVKLGAFVVVFGFFERFTPFWSWVPLGPLWEKKNIAIAKSTGLPLNYYSSETIGGHVLRRMVSSFADPVNLGAFLFAAFVAAWLVRNRVVMVATVVTAVLTVSKAALLGFLAFGFFRTRFLQSSTAAFLSASTAGALGLGFYVFSESHSTGSTAAHIRGFTSAASGLPQFPLGHGMGGTGVLAGLFSSESTTVSAESGVGVIISQLGLPGLAIFLAFFVMLVRASLGISDARERVVAMTLLVAWGLNAGFNEVAFSPNSAAPYFVILGLLIGAQARARLHAPEDEPAARSARRVVRRDPHRRAPRPGSHGPDGALRRRPQPARRNVGHHERLG